MNNATELADVRAAPERLFRLYHAQCVSPDRDTLFSLLEAGHSLNDPLRVGVELDFLDVPEFTAFRCLRNYFHHHQELKHVARLIPVQDYPITSLVVRGSGTGPFPTSGMSALRQHSVARGQHGPRKDENTF